ncbi:MAG: riboflavin kinase [Patescibacteria group bacterium]
MKLVGTIVPGLRQARELGYPTVNLSYELPAGTTLAHGVFVGTVTWDGEEGEESHLAAIVVGGNFRDDNPPKCEAYILDWSGDLYGRSVEFAIGELVRPLAHFDSLEALTAQIAADIEVIRGR